MTTVYFVRHAQPVTDWAEDRTRPLTARGAADAEALREVLSGVPFDAAVSSPFVRSRDTIAPCARARGLTIRTDERFRERGKGPEGNTLPLFRRRWADFAWHEPGGESLGEVQRRNMEALEELLRAEAGRTVLLGTHGTALSTILHHYDPSFGCDDFLALVDLLPLVLRMDFDGGERRTLTEVFSLRRGYPPAGR